MLSEQEHADQGGSAYPGGHGTVHGTQAGMTLRDYFAAAALQGLLATPGAVTRPDGQLCVKAKDWAYEAYSIADAMLAKRREPQSDQSLSTKGEQK